MSIQGSNLFYGSFTSTGAAQTISFGTLVTSFQMHNLTQYNNSSSTATLKRAWYIAGQPVGSYFGVTNTASAATDTSIYAATNGFTPIDYNALPVFPQVAISSVSQASSAVVTTSSNHNLAVGDTVLLTNVTGMQQLSGMKFSVTAVGSSTTFTIPVNTSSNPPWTAAGSGGNVQKVFLNRFVERETFITNITQATNGVVSTSTNHGYQVGDVISFRLPPNGAYGMTQLNYVRAPVIAVTATTFTLGLNTSGFTAWTWPLSANSFQQSRPVSIPVGAAGTAPNYLGDATNNVGFQGLILGSAVCGASSDVIYWTAQVGTNLNLI